MGHVSKDTLRRILVLYLIGKFRDGVFGNLRFQKVLYYALKNADYHPFLFQHTKLGQFSLEARTTRNELQRMGLVHSLPPNETRQSHNWMLAENVQLDLLEEAIMSFSETLKAGIDSSIRNFGYMSHNALKSIAHADPDLVRSNKGDVILEDNVPDIVELGLSEEDCDDLELALTPGFSEAMESILDGLENSDFDIGKVERSGKFL